MKKLIAASIILGTSLLLALPALSQDTGYVEPCQEIIEEVKERNTQNLVTLEDQFIYRYGRFHELLHGKKIPKPFREAIFVMFIPVTGEKWTIIATLQKDCTWSNGMVPNKAHEKLLSLTLGQRA